MTDYKEITRGTYDSVAEQYAARDKELVDETADVYAALNSFAELVPKGGKVLDIGCGTGRDTFFLAERGLQVTGIDFSQAMIERARKLVPSAFFEVKDFEQLDFMNEFDGVWANASLHHVPKEQLPGVLNSIKRALKPGGYCFIKVKHGQADGLRDNEKFGKVISRYFAYYGNQELRELIEGAGFSIQTLENTTEDEWIDVVARSV